MGSLKKMLQPETVVFIGSIDCEDYIERSIYNNLLASGNRRIIVINPLAPDNDFSASISSIDEHIDLAVITAPDKLLLNITEECGRKGVEGAIIVSAGPRTEAEERRKFEKSLLQIRKEHGIRIIGPDSNGIILPNEKLNATFLKANPVPGNIAFVSQSSTIGNTMLHWGIDNHIGLSMFASLGSMVDVDFADLIDFLQEDYFTKSIMLYMEHIKDAKKFLSASRYFVRNKPIVVFKPGRHPQSTELLFTHTGRQTGNDAVYDAAFRRVGIVRAKETNDFFDTARVLASRSLPRGPRLAVITNSGSIGIIACDTLAEHKGHLAVLSEKSMEKLRSMMPPYWDCHNPFDLFGVADVEKYVGVTDICLKDSGVDGVLVVYAPVPHCDPAELAKQISSLSLKTAKPIVAVWMGGQHASEGFSIFEEASIPVYTTPEVAVRACMYMFNYRKNIEILNETPEEIIENKTGTTNHLRAIIHNAVKEGKEILNAEEASNFLKNYEIAFVRKTSGDGDTGSTSAEIIDEWALKSVRDIDFGTAILFISMTGRRGNRTGFAVGLPPLNQVLARHLIDEAEFRTTDKTTMRHMEEVLINFSRLIVDFPEIAEIETEVVITADNRIYAKNATIQVDTNYRRGVANYPHLVIMPYPVRYIMPWKLRDGRDVLLRPVRAEDEPLMKEMISSLSEKTLRLRFFVAMEFDHKMLMNFCNIDYDREIAIVAELKEGDTKKIIGGGRLIVEPDSNSGQFALSVRDDFQGHGLGEKFLDITIGIAQDKGLQEIFGIVLTENEKMLTLSRKMGFRQTKLPGGITRVSLPLE